MRKIIKMRTANVRTQMVVKNVAASFVFKALGMLCSLIIVPLTINYVDDEKYGIWIAMTSIMYFFMFSDAGLGNGMRNYLTEAVSMNDRNKARSYFSTGTFVLMGVAAVLFLVTTPVVFALDMNKVFNTTTLDSKSLSVILCIASGFTLLQFVTKNVNIAYISMQRYAVSDLINFLISLCSLLVIWILAKTTQGNLLYIVVTFTFMPILIHVIASISLFRSHPEFRLSLASVDVNLAKQIVKKGLGFFVIQITSCLLIFGSANLLMSHYCGPVQVTVYNVAYKLFSVLFIGYTIIVSPLWNAYTDATVKDDYLWIKKTFNRSLLTWAGSVVAGLVLLALSGWIYKEWIGDSVAVPLSVSAAVLGYICMFNLNNCATALINGLNMIYVQIITSVVLSVLYIIAVFCIKGEYGIVGISLAMIFAYMLMSAVHLLQCYLIINKKAKGIWIK